MQNALDSPNTWQILLLIKRVDAIINALQDDVFQFTFIISTYEEYEMAFRTVHHHSFHDILMCALIGGVCKTVWLWRKRCPCLSRGGRLTSPALTMEDLTFTCFHLTIGRSLIAEITISLIGHKLPVPHNPFFSDSFQPCLQYSVWVWS